MQKSKMAALQIAVKRKEAKSKGEKERYTHFNAEFQRIARMFLPIAFMLRKAVIF